MCRHFHYKADMIEANSAPFGAAARVLTRAEHGISRQSISSAALRVLYGLKESGYAAYLVGGGVRDLLLGQRPKDFDIATNATPDQINRVFRNCRLIGRRFVIAHVRFGGDIIEVTTFRGSDGDGMGGTSGDRLVETAGRILRDNVFGSLEEDAERRDFTVNAMYYNIEDFSVTDYAGGLSDLSNKVIRLIGDPDRRFREDPVRMLRAARLAAKLGFRIDAASELKIAELKELLHEIPPARLFDEVLKLFMGGHGEKSWRELARLDLLSVLFPDLKPANLRANRVFLEQALQSTDARIQAEKPVSAGFFFAVLGWPMLQARMPDKPTQDQRSEAIDSVLIQLSRIIALPRRYAMQVREIWEMLPRLFGASATRARRILPNPRFRAAYDFLLLLGSDNPTLKSLAERWTKAQLPDADLDDIFGKQADASQISGAATGAAVLGLIVQPAEAAAVDAPLRKKRRRNRKPK